MKKLLLLVCALLSINILSAQKNVLIEEVTGTWCNNCPSGIFYLDSLHHTYDNVIAIAVHTKGVASDPMAYEDYFSKMNLNSAPSANIGRRYTAKNVDKWFESVEAEMEQKAKAIVSVETQFDEAERLLTSIVTIEAIEDMSGAYRVAGVVCEDAVTGPAPQYNQANVYASYYIDMGGFEDMPDPIPANRIAFDHVARQMLGGYEGETGFPSSLVAGQTYAQTFTYYVPEEYDHNYIRVVGILLDSQGLVDNAGISQYANGKDNAAPKFTSSPKLDAYAAVEYLYNIYVHDSDDKNLTITVEEKPEWLSFEQKNKKHAVIKGITNEPGEYDVVLKVSDGETETLQKYTIVVNDPLTASWETLGVRGFSTVGYGYILGTCSFDGKIYMFMHESNYPALYEYTPKTNTWTKISSPLEEIGYDGDIAAGTDGIYVTYTLKSNNVIKVKRYNGEWSDVDNIGKIGTVPKIAVDDNNVIYVAFNDEGENNRYYVNRFKNGNWENVGASYITAGGGSWARLALDVDGTPYVSWVDFFAGKLVYVSKLIGELWLTAGGGAVSDVAMDKNHQDLAIDAYGNIYIAYRTAETDLLTAYCFNGEEWVCLGSDIADGPIKGLDVAIDNEQNFYVTYADGNAENKVSVVKYDGEEWSFVGLRGFTESASDSYLAMTMHNNSPCVVYTDIDKGYKSSAKYYKIADFLYPPYNLKAEIIEGGNVSLTWESPIGTTPLKYNVYRNDALIGNTAQTSYIDEDLETGRYDYTVSAVYEEGESEKTVSVIVDITSIMENNEVAFVLYPNPAEYYITIESIKDAEVKIYSVNGQMLSQQNISEGINKIDLSNLNSGMYFISVNDTMVKVVKK